MKVILLEEVKGLGKANTVVEVKDGYAINYLIPKKIAVYDNTKNHAELEKKLEKLAAQEAQRRADAEALKTKIEALVLNFSLKANNDVAFGNVSAKQIVEELKKHDVIINHTNLDRNLKLQLGSHELKVKLYKDIIATLKVEVAKI